jgi:DNA-binding transcriptional ArsR family regulator
VSSGRAEDSVELTGTALRIYLHLLASRRPVGVRELARALDTPVSTVHYHLKRLEEEGLVQRGSDGYTVARALAPPGYILVARRPLHRLTVYAAFFSGLAMGEAALCALQGVSPDRLLVLLTSASAALIFLVEHHLLTQRR